jgi:futalosine hydrolase
MNILLVSATYFEVDFKKIGNSVLQPGVNISELITGVGLPNAMYRLTEAVLNIKYDFIIQAGIAGSFNNNLALGEVIIIEEDTFADIGVNENGSFSNLFNLGFADKDEMPFTNGWLKNNTLINTHLPCHRGITVNTINSDKTVIANQVKLYNADVESMEGAALHYVCLLNNIPFLQLRSISNAVGERDKSKWKMAEAIDSLNEALPQVLYNIIH